MTVEEKMIELDGEINEYSRAAVLLSDLLKEAKEEGDIEGADEIRSRLIRCKGRNGVFKMASYEVEKYEDKTMVFIYSKKKGLYAPIRFSGKKSDLIELFSGILTQIIKN